MTQVQIINRIQNDFGMVPRALWQMDMSANAKLCAAYLFCLRDGAAPYVAQIEKETGLGRDARRKAFAVLEAKGIIRWSIERDGAQRIVAKSLIIDYTPVLVAGHAPENQSDGSHAPEKPSDGKPAPVEVETRPCRDGKSGDLLEKEKKQTRRRATRLKKPVATSEVPTRMSGGRRLYLGPDGQWWTKPRDPHEAQMFDQWLCKENA